MSSEGAIVERYSFNVPKFKTSQQSIVGGRGGKCGRNCAICPAFGKQCKGCSLIESLDCPDRACKGDQCSHCALLCNRGGDRLSEAISFIGGLEVDRRPTVDSQFTPDCEYYPSIHRPIRGNTFAGVKAVSIPWHKLYNFHEMRPITTDPRSMFRIPPEIPLIVNSYMKDDKVMVLFEIMMAGKFIALLRSFTGVDYWHTPCFSVFNVSSKMDQVLNFKRQFWIGDIMRDAGFNVIQEVLFTDRNKHLVRAGAKDAIEIILEKGIKKVSQCGQLDSSVTESDIYFYRNLLRDSTLIITGLQQSLFSATAAAKCRVVRSDYGMQYNRRGQHYEE